jgi:hypothetical protein
VAAEKHGELALQRLGDTGGALMMNRYDSGTAEPPSYTEYRRGISMTAGF